MRDPLYIVEWFTGSAWVTTWWTNGDTDDTPVPKAVPEQEAATAIETAQHEYPNAEFRLKEVK